MVQTQHMHIADFYRRRGLNSRRDYDLLLECQLAHGYYFRRSGGEYATCNPPKPKCEVKAAPATF